MLYIFHKNNKPAAIVEINIRLQGSVVKMIKCLESNFMPKSKFWYIRDISLYKQLTNEDKLKYL